MRWFDVAATTLHAVSSYVSQLGLTAGAAGADADAELFESLLDTMAATGADFTRTFRTLMSLELPADAATSDDMTDAEAAAVKRVATALGASLASREDLLAAIRPRIEEERVTMLVSGLLAPSTSCFQALSVTATVLANPLPAAA